MLALLVLRYRNLGHGRPGFVGGKTVAAEGTRPARSATSCKHAGAPPVEALR
jgi:hypothetical protein